MDNKKKKIALLRAVFFFLCCGSLFVPHPSAAPPISSVLADPTEPGLVDIGDVLQGLPVLSGPSRGAGLVGCSQGRQSRGTAGV